MKSSLFPTNFQTAHDLCFFIHDLLVNLFNSAEEQDIFNYEFELKEELLKYNFKNDDDIFEFLTKNQLFDHRSKILKIFVLRSLLSDSLHCIYETLSASIKGKLNVSFMLIRKPIQESLYLFESMIINELEFAEELCENPLNLRPSITMKNKGVFGHIERINTVIEKLNIGELFSANYIANLRYNKKCEDSFDIICNHAMHLFTEHNAIKTEKLNINFIFSDYDSKLSQWNYLYSRLPYLLLYLYYLIEHLMEEICPTEKTYIEEMEIRIFSHMYLWINDMKEEYYTEEILKLLVFSTNKLKIFITNSLNKEFNLITVKNIAQSGINYKDFR